MLGMEIEVLARAEDIKVRLDGVVGIRVRLGRVVDIIARLGGVVSISLFQLSLVTGHVERSIADEKTLEKLRK